jgi:hypothetical protein
MGTSFWCKIGLHKWKLKRTYIEKVFELPQDKGDWYCKAYSVFKPSRKIYECSDCCKVKTVVVEKPLDITPKWS